MSGRVLPFPPRAPKPTLSGLLMASLEKVAAQNERRAVLAFLLARGLHDEAKAIEKGEHL